MATTTATTAELAERDAFVTEWNGGEGESFAESNPTFGDASEADKIAMLKAWPPFDRWKQWIEDGIAAGRDYLRSMLLLDFMMEFWFGPGGPGGPGGR